MIIYGFLDLKGLYNNLSNVQMEYYIKMQLYASTFCISTVRRLTRHKANMNHDTE